MDLSPASLPDPRWSTAVPDWQDRILAGKSLIPELPLHDAFAEKALRIFKRLRVPDIVDSPTYGEVCEDWVFDFVRAVFGSYDPETKRRMISEFFLLVPKKNGKSAIAAAIIVTAAILNERPQAELFLIAPTQKISGIAFKQAAGIIRLDDTLSTVFLIQGHQKTITHRHTEAVIMVLSADGDIVTGSKGCFILVDESHVLLSKEKAADIMIELRGGLASRPEGFLLQITTQSKQVPQGEFRRELNKVRAVRDGELDLPILAVLYELPPETAREEGWRDETLWPLINPNIERSVSMDFLRKSLREADGKGPDAVALFVSQHLNVQVGEGLTQDRWIGASHWAKAKIEALDWQGFKEVCEVVVVGIDGGGLDDLLGFSAVGRRKTGSGWISFSRAWAHPITLERRQSIAPILQDLADAGDLVLCQGETQDVIEVAGLCAELNDEGLLPEKNAIGLDPYGVAAIIDALIEAGLSEEQLASVSQGFKLNGAIKGTERKLFDGSLKHADQPMMTWSVSNAKTEPRGNAVVVTKAMSGSGKIDPVMALFSGVMLMSLNPEAMGGGLDDFLSNAVMVA